MLLLNILIDTNVKSFEDRASAPISNKVVEKKVVLKLIKLPFQFQTNEQNCSLELPKIAGVSQLAS
jgi:hypothetical protein